MMNKKMNGQERRQLRLEDVVKHDTLIHSIGFNPTDGISLSRMKSSA